MITSAVVVLVLGALAALAIWHGPSVAQKLRNRPSSSESAPVTVTRLTHNAHPLLTDDELEALAAQMLREATDLARRGYPASSEAADKKARSYSAELARRRANREALARHKGTVTPVIIEGPSA